MMGENEGVESPAHFRELPAALAEPSQKRRSEPAVY
jgi:hypothetical protein